MCFFVANLFLFFLLLLTIDIKPGWKAGTKITFPREGDQSPNTVPADIVFIIKDKPHQFFKRDGCDLVFTARISLREVNIFEITKKNLI